MQVECDVCNGSGVVPPTQCPLCHGTGLIEEEERMPDDDGGRQRRTVAGLLEDLEGKIAQKRAQVAGSRADHDRLLAQMGTLQDLLVEWQEVPKG